jgi:hypothetical protein
VIKHYQFQTYIETFGGSGAILFAKEPSPVEVYNDLYSDLVTLYPSKIKVIVRIHTDKGTFDMSEDHKVMLNDVYRRRLIKAGDLKPGMSLFSSTIKPDDRNKDRYVKPRINSGCNAKSTSRGYTKVSTLEAERI